MDSSLGSNATVECGFGFLDITRSPKKPRDRRWTIMSDRSIPISGQPSLLELLGDVVDRVKLVDHVGLIYRLPAEVISRKIRLYRDYGIGTFPGGVPFEIAFLQGKSDEYFQHVKKLGFQGVEVSSDCIPPIPAHERHRLIALARSMGLEVFTEVGYKVVGDKFGKHGLSAEAAVKTIQMDIRAGACKVTIENNELLSFIQNKDSITPKTIADEIGLQHLLFEIGGGGILHRDIAKWLFQGFGPNVNVENVEPEQVVHTEAMRHGLSRAVDFCFFEGGMPVTESKSANSMLANTQRR